MVIQVYDWYSYFSNMNMTNNFPKFLYDYYTFREPLFGHILSNVPTKGSILEVGCGTGLMSVLLSACDFARVHAVDSDERIVKLAQNNNTRLYGHATVYQMNLFDIPKRYAHKEFDLVWACSVLEHFKEPQLSEAIQCMKWVGKKQLLMLPTMDDELVQSLAPNAIRYTKKMARVLCELNGLRVVSIFGIGTELQKWSRLLIPPILMKHMPFVKWPNIGVMCEEE